MEDREEEVMILGRGEGMRSEVDFLENEGDE